MAAQNSLNNVLCWHLGRPLGGERDTRIHVLINDDLLHHHCFPLELEGLADTLACHSLKEVHVSSSCTGCSEASTYRMIDKVPLCGVFLTEPIISQSLNMHNTLKGRVVL